MPWDDLLSKRQLAAARHVGTHARLLAGPGTGKTLTLTRRLIRLVTEYGVEPVHIIAVAFTRINAQDLRSSVASGVSEYGVEVPPVSTLHSFALKQLLRNSAVITTLPRPLRIADDYEEKKIIHGDIAQVLGLKKKAVSNKFIDLSSDWQSLAIEEPDYQPPDPRFMGAWQQHRRVYGYTLRSELVWQLKHALEENPDGFYIEDVRYLLIDEYQDLNKCDLAFVRMLSDRGAEVFCVGDDDQSIYGFRRAHPIGIRRFLDEYQPSTPLELDICWRCDRAIINIGQYVADMDPHRLEKPLTPHDSAGEGHVHLLRFSRQDKEAVGVVSICRYLIEIKGLAPDDILVLLRTDHQGRYSSVLRDALTKVGLDVNVKAEKGGPLDELEGRYLLSLLRLAVNVDDDLAWRTVLQYSRLENGIGAKTILNVYNYAADSGLRSNQALKHIEENPHHIQRGNLVQQEIAEVRMLTDLIADPTLIEHACGGFERDQVGSRQELIERVTGLAETIIPSREERQVVLAQITASAERSNASSLRQLLNELAGPEDTPEQEMEPAKINILSMHRAKGLSAKAVIIVAAEEQLIPGRAVGEAADDERRLLYVSITRAKHYLFVTYCNTRTGRQMHSGSDSGNPRRTLTPFLRGALPIENGLIFGRDLIDDRV